MKTQQKTCERCGELYYPNRSDGMRRAGEIRIQRFCSRICGQRSRRENNVRVRTMNPEQAAYLAGLFEGEGCIYYEPKSGLRLVLSNTDRALVDCLVIFTGIGVANYKKMRGIGRLIHGMLLLSFVNLYHICLEISVQGQNKLSNSITREPLVEACSIR